jgi:dihydrofolate synthase/folylpolyglutamate synthase
LTSSRALQIEAYDRASAALLGLIQGKSAESQTAPTRLRRAEARLQRTRTLLSALGDPQKRYPVVHVTGTSGKGSTSVMIAAILSASGYRVGLRTSPYLQVATEKLQIGSSLIDAESFARETARVLELGRQLFPSRQRGERLGYAEAWAALALAWVAESHVEIAVVEVGAGGRYDATNVVAPAVSVITSVGLDHVRSLGPALADIAWHKAGIIKRGAAAVVGDLPAEAWAVVEAVARENAVPVTHAREFTALDQAPRAMCGGFHQANARAAVATIEALRQRGVTIPDTAITAGLKTARIPGRLEPMPDAGPAAVWIDGAHNADKMAAVAREAEHRRATTPGPVIVLGLLRAKDATAIVARVARVASAIVATEPSVLGKASLPSAELAAAVSNAGFAGQVAVALDPDQALDCARSIAVSIETDVLVTGSLYLAGQVRRQWYPDREIVLQRTPWPSSPPSPALQHREDDVSVRTE